MPFYLKNTSIEGLLIVEPIAHFDDRGFFMETYKESEFAALGIGGKFVQDNHSTSLCGVVRGLHFQKYPHAQGKLVRVTRGKAWDVAVDIRRESKTFGRWYGLELSAENKYMLWIPEGFAHGFQALEDNTELQYKCTAEYAPSYDSGILWNDPELAIEWPLCDSIVSRKDEALRSFAEYRMAAI